ncbi:hypothetical protein [Nonomuraea rubra]|uniref:hypothetical protein n=1 Tax=Nonomuraea rubra TaxID=46180 RepID=UPI0031EF4A20
MIDMATGLSMEPPTACSARAATSQGRLGASEHSTEPSVNSARPVWNVAAAADAVAGGARPA